MISQTKFTMTTDKGVVKLEQKESGMFVAQFMNGTFYPSACCCKLLADVDEWLDSHHAAVVKVEGS